MQLINVVHADGVLTSGFTLGNKAFSISSWIYPTKTNAIYVAQHQASTTNQSLAIRYMLGQFYRMDFWSNAINTPVYLDYYIINNSNILKDKINNTSNILHDKITFITTDIDNIEFEINIIENLLLPTGSTFLSNKEKIFFIGYKDRSYVNYKNIMTAFIIPLKQVDKIINDHNSVDVLNYVINYLFLYVFAKIPQVDLNYSMTQGIIAYKINDLPLFSFTTKISITNTIGEENILYDIGGNSLSYRNNANNLILSYKQKIYVNVFTTAFFYMVHHYDHHLLLVIQMEFLQH